MYCPKVTTSTSVARRAIYCVSMCFHKSHQGEDVEGEEGELTPQRLPQLLLRLAQSQHNTRLRNDPLPTLLRPPQHPQALPEPRPPIPHHRRQRLHRLHIMRIHIQPAPRHQRHHRLVPRIIPRQRLHQHPRRLVLDLPHRLREMRRPAVRQIIPIHTREHHVPEPPPRQRFRRVLRLVGIQRRGGAARLYGAEAAASRAGVAHEHDGGRGGGFVVAAPAVADVGTSSFFADGVQV